MTGHPEPPGGTTSGVDRLMTLAEADALTSSLRPLGTESATLADSLGRTLATALVADRAFPPYRRAMMDGFAFAADFLPSTGPVILAGLHAAGDPPPVALPSGHAWEIMTGAIVPDDCDTVVPYEDLEAGRPRPGFKKGQFIHEAGSDAASGTVLVDASSTIGPVEVAIAASVGLEKIEVFRRANVAILSTGDEAVPSDVVPRAWEIRRSNGPMLEAMLARRGNAIVFHDHAPDDPAVCGRQLDEALAKCDVLLICGGISKGKKDFIRGLLEERLGKPAFHGVEQRPGKPLAFWPGPPVVFALPGNPVSVLATFTRHVLPALSRLEGREFLPMKVRMNEAPVPLPKFSWLLTVAAGPDGTLLARPPSNSGDFISVAGSCGIVEVPPAADPAELSFFPFPNSQ
ncbi:molybdopterin molybdotransferase MoeA [Luteolibacter arcticus]|uniref:Molybdopterin molybdenumtransferase n=1 Tax=Luteolibacter arcticus TaxID=1581411 RepID=A0ABT3GCQ3_9BACT|nr:molybdopterin molybdotransferase MoeA [Luteolibacter arcticus]MCW1921417.1 molybdopterin molybdotransferase MoeA [Luteolibacter arcticus]